MSRYSRRFHERRNTQAKYEALARAALAAYAVARPPGPPESAADIGCSTGALLAELGRQGPVAYLYGLDHGVDTDLMKFRGAYVDFDLESDEPSELVASATDLVVCQEVLEHIEPRHTDAALEVLGRFSGPRTVLVFGAATVGQPGTHHVNCRLRAEWLDLLAKKGWSLHLEATARYQAALAAGGIPTKSCYFQNTACLTRKG